MRCKNSLRACRQLALVVVTTGWLAWPASPACAREASHSSTARAAHTGCEFRDGILVHGQRDRPDVALTFDACPTSHVPPFAPEIVNALVTAAVPATFFISGKWAEAHPDDLRSLADVPLFAIGLHGYRHHRLNGASDAAVGEEIEEGRRALEHLGVQPQALFRPPFGDHPPGLAALAHRAGVTPILWDVAPGDPSPRETAADIERDVLRQTRGGSIIVLHVNGRGVGTGAAVPKLVARLRQHGFHLVTVAELLQRCQPDAPIVEQSSPAP